MYYVVYDYSFYELAIGCFDSIVDVARFLNCSYRSAFNSVHTGSFVSCRFLVCAYEMDD